MSATSPFRPAKVIPQNLIMAESVPAGQRYTYLSTHSMDAMLAPDYFVSELYRFHAGDTLRVLQMEQKTLGGEGNRVIAYLDLVVCAVSKAAAKSIKFHREPWVDADGRYQDGPHYIDYEGIEAATGEKPPTVTADSRYVVAGAVRWKGPHTKWTVVSKQGDEEIIHVTGLEEKEHAEAIASGKIPLP